MISRRGKAGSLDLLLDTQILVWLQTGDARLRQQVQEALFDSRNALCVSAVTAWEFSDLVKRGRLPALGSLDQLIRDYGLSVVDFPARVWPVVMALPDIHRDPIDRMLIAHALVDGYTLVTADATIRQYPVKTLW